MANRTWNKRIRSQALRRGLWNRDRGICNGCGLDCEARGRVLRFALLVLGEYAVEVDGEIFRGEDLDLVRLRYHFEKWFGPVQNFTGHTWEVDHLIGVSDGGSDRFDNLQTLCLGCHREKTRRCGQRRILAG